MLKILSFVFLLAFFTILHAESLHPPQPQLGNNFSLKPNQVQSARTCSYTLIIKTSCSSTRYTRDQISLAFGDKNGNEVHGKRLDDARAKIFERCSTDTFQINGPCVHDACYLYLLRRGSDGWKPEFVKINSNYTKAATFYFNESLPDGVWFGFNLCRGRPGSPSPH
ncbi:Embryo-specific [Quillaja saponaria]|uniref:Embryo-specific n=1 Tax=Quillaja saponaria TaxID=32244 RepID=A0AAD7PIB2_QUISA|nr:Embryo-specific [Quillaja saponaria]